MLVTEWNSSNMLTVDSFTSEYNYYKGYHLGENFQELFRTGPSDLVVYNSWKTVYYITTNVNGQILRNFPDYNKKTYSNHMPNILQCAIYKYITLVL